MQKCQVSLSLLLLSCYRSIAGWLCCFIQTRACFSPRYFPLLAKQKPNHPEYDILLNVFALLFAKNVSPVTVAVTMDIAETLATAEDFVASETETELTVNDCVLTEPEDGTIITTGYCF